nr:MAG TPA: hypothetical protein [Caudoviricetes sp.]
MTLHIAPEPQSDLQRFRDCQGFVQIHDRDLSQYHPEPQSSFFTLSDL